MDKAVSSKELGFGLPLEIAKLVEEAGLSDLAEHCHFLYGQAFYANTELSVLETLLRAPSQFENDVICAPCFCGVVRICLVESIFMNCARLYDGTGDISLGTLLRLARERVDCIDARARTLTKTHPVSDYEKPIRHALAIDEECFYPKQVDEQREWEALAAKMGCSIPENDGEDAMGRVHHSEVSVPMAAEELLDLWIKRLGGLNKLNDNLRTQRNKVFAHNGLETLGYDEFIEKAPLKFGDMQKLIDFALDVTIELNGIVSGVVWPRKAGNANDVEGLLRYVDLGMRAFEQGLI